MQCHRPLQGAGIRPGRSTESSGPAGGAVNTIKLTDDGVLLGDNTDGAGLVADLKAHGVALAGSRILLLGREALRAVRWLRCWPSNPRPWLSPTVLTLGRSSWLLSFAIWGGQCPDL